MAQGPYFGKLGEVGVAEILSVLFRNKATGTLDLQHEKDQRRLVLAGGEIRSARSNHMEQRIGYLLVKDGCITQEQLQQGLESKPSSVPLGQFFRQHEAITEEALNAALWHLVQAIIDNCFNWMEGIFRYNPGQAALTKATEILLSTTDLLYCTFRKNVSDTLIRKLLGDGSSQAAPAPDFQVRIRVLHIPQQEAAVLSALAKPGPIGAVITSLPGDMGVNYRIAAAAVASGLIHLADHPVPDEDEFFSRLSQSQPAQPAGGKKKRTIKWIRPKKREIEYTERDITIMRDKIIQKAKIIGTMNYYEIIECPVRATQKEIHFSYMNLGSFYHPDLAQDARFADLMPQLQLIFQHIEKAYLVLVHHESRMKYDRNIPGAFRSATEYI